jgi:uncharacterized membrane protein HdeD (DUF308 family)
MRDVLLGLLLLALGIPGVVWGFRMRRDDLSVFRRSPVLLANLIGYLGFWPARVLHLVFALGMCCLGILAIIAGLTGQ